ncbi:MAG: hypothetical protein NXI19_18875 [Alphaproteobacteria bacterium]|nr:hypothetical protein [Alphaproteobacteria bacterium]
MKHLAFPAVLLFGLSVSGCSDLSGTQQKTLSGGAIGAGVGAAGTLVTGGCVTCGAVIGGAVGAGAGYVLSKTED